MHMQGICLALTPELVPPCADARRLDSQHVRGVTAHENGNLGCAAVEGVLTCGSKRGEYDPPASIVRRGVEEILEEANRLAPNCDHCIRYWYDPLLDRDRSGKLSA